MIVDSHLQVYSAKPLRYPLAADRPFDPGPAPAELALVQMEQTGVDRACLVQPRPYGYAHSYLIDTLAAYPQRFVGVGRVGVAVPDAAVSLRGLMQVPGLRGIRCALADPESARRTVDAGSACWQAAPDLGAVVCLQMRPGAAVAAVRLAEAWPLLTVVIDHLGAVDPRRSIGAAQGEAILGLARRQNVWIKCSGLFHTSRAGGFHAATRSRGCETSWRPLAPAGWSGAVIPPTAWARPATSARCWRFVMTCPVCRRSSARASWAAPLTGCGVWPSGPSPSRRTAPNRLVDRPTYGQPGRMGQTTAVQMACVQCAVDWLT